jgi:excisionase family DNA binding protein
MTTSTRTLEPAAYSISEFCELCGFGRDFAYKEIRAGRLRAVKAGRLTRIPASERERYISQLPPLKLRAA